MTYALYCLNNYSDTANYETPCLSLLDLIHSDTNIFIPYIKEMYPLLNRIINADDAKNNIFTLII